MSYSLNNAVRDLRKRQPWMTRVILREPLVGLVDGNNKLFNTINAPISTDVTVYDFSGQPVTATVLSDAGVIELAVAPSLPHTISYTHLAIGDDEMKGICEDGFALMEVLLPRGLFLFDNGSEIVISAAADAESDPTYGGIAFSQSVIQRRFYLDCCQVSLFKSLLSGAASAAFMIREERVGGLQIDRRQQYQAWKAALADSEEALNKSLFAAAQEWGDEDIVQGDLIAGARSDYRLSRDWWKGSKQAKQWTG